MTKILGATLQRRHLLRLFFIYNHSAILCESNWLQSESPCWVGESVGRSQGR